MKAKILTLTLALTLLVAAGPAQAQDKTYTNSIGMEFVLIPAGSFMMGSAEGHEDERPMHYVTISRPFYLGKYEVTQAQWMALMGNNHSRFKGPNNPVEVVSWDDVQVFINKLNAKEGHNRYRLPTEAEWEYAARAGTKTTYSFGDDEKKLSRHAWYSGNSGRTTHPVGQKHPNPWGLHDVHGNVSEWVWDWYDENYYANSPDVDPQGPSIGSFRVLRGGSWYGNAKLYRSARRDYSPPDEHGSGMGLRLALSPGQ